ncbi:hypothetical protein D3C81_2156420 [compost metagenome]
MIHREVIDPQQLDFFQVLADESGLHHNPLAGNRVSGRIKTNQAFEPVGDAGRFALPELGFRDSPGGCATRRAARGR